MKKEFITFKMIRSNAIKLAHTIYASGFMPDVIYVSLRGGAYLGNIISEYFKLKADTTDQKPVLYAAVVARSYLGTQKKLVKVAVDGWTYDPKYLRVGDKVLLVDDIYDTGYTMDYLANIIIQSGIPPEALRIAVHDYKERRYLPHNTLISPDYYCRKITLNADSETDWIHYLSHELVGLTPAEIETYYDADEQSILKDPNST